MTEHQADEPVTAREQDIQAVSRTAQILGLFSPETPELSVAEATRRLGLKRTTVHRYFSSMISSGLLERVEDSALVRPGRSILQLGSFMLGQQRIMQMAPAYMRELALEIKISIVLSLWGTSGPVVSLVEEADHPTLVTVRVGSQLALELLAGQGLPGLPPRPVPCRPAHRQPPRAPAHRDPRSYRGDPTGRHEQRRQPPRHLRPRGAGVRGDRDLRHDRGRRHRADAAGGAGLPRGHGVEGRLQAD